MRSVLTLVKPTTTLFRFLSLGAGRMADLAAGKKAAAIKAIDDYVQVEHLTPSMVASIQSDLLFRTTRS